MVFQSVQTHEAFADYCKELCIATNPLGKNSGVCYYVAKAFLPKELSSAWSL